MEKEANEFAVHAQFLGDKFGLEAQGLSFGLPSALELKDRYATSIESSIRHYVEISERDCLCQVFRIEGDIFRLHYFIRPLRMSNGFSTDCQVGGALSETHPLALQLRKVGFGCLIQDEVRLPESVVVQRQCFCDGRRVFVLEFESA